MYELKLELMDRNKNWILSTFCLTVLTISSTSHFLLKSKFLEIQWFQRITLKDVRIWVTTNFHLHFFKLSSFHLLLYQFFPRPEIWKPGSMMTMEEGEQRTVEEGEEDSFIVEQKGKSFPFLSAFFLASFWKRGKSNWKEAFCFGQSLAGDLKESCFFGEWIKEKSLLR